MSPRWLNSSTPSAASAELHAHGDGSGMDGREGGSRGTDAPAGTCLGLSTCRLSSQVIANGPISANWKVADPMVAMATARCVGNGVKTMSTNSTWGRVVVFILQNVGVHEWVSN